MDHEESDYKSPRVMNNGFSIDLSNDGISNLSTIDWDGYTTIETLNLSGNPLANLDGLPNVPIKKLVIRHCMLANLHGLAGHQIYEFDCSDNNLQSLKGLPSCLYQLSCNNNNLSSLEYLPSSVRIINFSNNSVSSFRELTNCVEVYCQGNNIDTIDTELPYLQVLNISNNNLRQLDNLYGYNNLRILHCANNLLTNLYGVPWSVVQLNCKYNFITSFHGLNPADLCRDPQLFAYKSGLSHLKELYASNNRISSYQYLPGRVESLYCDCNPIPTYRYLPASVNYLSENVGWSDWKKRATVENLRHGFRLLRNNLHKARINNLKKLRIRYWYTPHIPVIENNSIYFISPFCKMSTDELNNFAYKKIKINQ